MGTRSLTYVVENGKRIVCMYRQYDGYPSGHGKELYEFLQPITIVNGLGGDSQNVANGAGCLAAQMVAHFKNGPGGIYLKSVTPGDCWQDYEYYVNVNDNDNAISVSVKQSRARKFLFEGDVQQFGEWCTSTEY